MKNEISRLVEKTKGCIKCIRIFEGKPDIPQFITLVLEGQIYKGMRLIKLLGTKISDSESDKMLREYAKTQNSIDGLKRSIKVIKSRRKPLVDLERYNIKKPKMGKTQFVKYCEDNYYKYIITQEKIMEKVVNGGLRDITGDTANIKSGVISMATDKIKAIDDLSKAEDKYIAAVRKILV